MQGLQPRHVCCLRFGMRGASSVGTTPRGRPAGADVVRSELTALGVDGPYRLSVAHARGTIVEYFSDTAAALNRQGELEDLLEAARSGWPVLLKRAI